MMDLNVSNIDRMLRLALGIGLLSAASSGAIGAWGWIGILPLLTGVVGWCPLYRVFGWRTTAR